MSISNANQGADPVLVGVAVKIVDFDNESKTKNLIVFLNKTTMDCQISIFDSNKKTTHSAYLDRSILLDFARSCEEYIKGAVGANILKFFDGTQGSTNFLRVGHSDVSGFYKVNIIKNVWHSDPNNLDENTIVVPVSVLETIITNVLSPQA